MMQMAGPGARVRPDRVFCAWSRVNADILIRSLLLQAGFVSFLLIGADFGDVTLAANQILLQFLYITSHAMDGFTFSAEALVGQAMGARARGRLRQSVLMTSAWSRGDGRGAGGALCTRSGRR